jgi:hypothetical protein
VAEKANIFHVKGVVHAVISGLVVCIIITGPQRFSYINLSESNYSYCYCKLQSTCELYLAASALSFLNVEQQQFYLTEVWGSKSIVIHNLKLSHCLNSIKYSWASRCRQTTDVVSSVMMRTEMVHETLVYSPFNLLVLLLA